MLYETPLTSGPGSRVLTHCNVWSADGRWVVYDTRPDPAGDVFDGPRIEAVHTETREVRVLYEARDGARCGVATWHPAGMRVAFILGPDRPTPDWTYGPARRRGVAVDFDNPGVAHPLDARNLTPPFTPGALRGGSHVHVWHPRGDWVSFTYEDHVLSQFPGETDAHEANRRTVGVSVPGRVAVPGTHPRNHGGDYFSVVVVRTTGRPRPGSDDVSRAFEEAWVGTRRALAFQGHVLTADDRVISEAFIAELPDDLTVPGDGPLEGTDTRMPCPPRGVTQRRLTFTADRPFPGIQGPRHWLRSSPDGSRVGLLMRDERGLAQFWTVSPNGGPPTQVTRNPFPVASAFTWHPGGGHVAFVGGGSVCVADVASGETRQVTAPSDPPPRPEACVFSPDGSRVAFVRHLDGSNQILVAETGL